MKASEVAKTASHPEGLSREEDDPPVVGAIKTFFMLFTLKAPLLNKVKACSALFPWEKICHVDTANIVDATTLPTWA